MVNGDGTIFLCVTPTFEDYLHVIRQKSRRRLLVVLILVLALVIGNAAFTMKSQNGSDAEWVVYTIPGVLMMAFLVYSLTRGVRNAAWRQWNSGSQNREPRTYLFSDAGIQVMATSFDAFNAWSNIVSAERIGSQFLLGINSQVCYFIPVAAFDNEVDITRFRQLVANKVKSSRLG